MNHANNAGDTPLLLSLTHPHQRKCERNGGMWPTDNDHYLVPQVGEVRTPVHPRVALRQSRS